MSISKITVVSLPKNYNVWKFFPLRPIELTVMRVEDSHQPHTFEYSLVRPLELGIGDIVLYPRDKTDHLPSDFERAIAVEFMKEEEFKGEPKTGPGPIATTADSPQYVG